MSIASPLPGFMGFQLQICENINSQAVRLTTSVSGNLLFAIAEVTGLTHDFAIDFLGKRICVQNRRCSGADDQGRSAPGAGIDLLDPQVLIFVGRDRGLIQVR